MCPSRPVRRENTSLTGSSLLLTESLNAFDEVIVMASHYLAVNRSRLCASDQASQRVDVQPNSVKAVQPGLNQGGPAACHWIKDDLSRYSIVPKRPIHQL